MIKKILKYLSYFVLGLLAFISLLILLIRFGALNGPIRDLAVDQVNDTIDGEFTIGDIDGNPLGNFEIYDIELKTGDDKLVSVRKLSLDYDILALLSKNVIVNRLLIDSLGVTLSQRGDSSWNYEGLAKPDTLRIESAEDEEAGEFEWNIVLNDFQTNNSSVTINPLEKDDSIPSRIEGINIGLNGAYSAENKSLNLIRFEFETEEPELRLVNLEIYASGRRDNISVERMKLRTEENEIDLTGSYNFESGSGSITVSTEPVSFGEFKDLIPALDVEVNPVLNLTAFYSEDSSAFDIDITDGNQEIEAIGRVRSPGGENPAYRIRLRTEGIDAGKWLNDDSLLTDINSEIKLTGSGFDPKKIDAVLSAEISKSIIGEYNIDSLIVAWDYNSGDSRAVISLGSDFGQFDFKLNVSDIFEVARYELTADAGRVNFAPLLLDENAVSELNFSLEAEGTGFDIDSSEGFLLLDMDSSSFMEYNIENLSLSLRKKNNLLKLESLTLSNESLKFESAGVLSIDDTLNFSYRLDIKNLESLGAIRDSLNLGLAAEIDGTLRGKTDSLAAYANYRLNDLKYREYFIEGMSGNSLFELYPDSIAARGAVTLSGIKIGDSDIKSIDLKADYGKNRIAAGVDINVNDSLGAGIEAVAEIDSVIEIMVGKLNLNLQGETWSNKSDSLRIEIGDDRYRIANLELVSGNSSVRAGGEIDLSGESIFFTEIENFNLNILSNYIEDSRIAGDLNFRAELAGAVSKPNLKGNFTISDAHYGKNSYKEIKGEIDYERRDLISNVKILTINDNLLEINASLPMNIIPEEGEQLISGSDPLDIKITADSLDLSYLSNEIEIIDSVKGYINTQLNIYNTLDDPLLKGTLDLYEGAVSSYSYGIDYKGISLSVNADSTKIEMSELNIDGKEGKLSSKGYIIFEGSLIEGDIDSLDVDLKAENFIVADSRNIEMKINGNVNFRSVQNIAEFLGEVTVLRSKFWLPGISDQFGGGKSKRSVPLLVQATAGIDTSYLDRDTAVISVSEPPKIIKKLDGKLKVQIPRNTWIQAPNLNMELEGNLDLIQKDVKFEVFGFIRILRGSYSLYGKKFRVEKGELNFNGGEKINPGLYLEVEYEFRDPDRNKQSLLLTVTGSSLAPELKFTINNDPIEEKDAISYVLFGVSLDELSQDERSSLSSSTNQLAQGLASNILASQLSNTLGQSLGIDVIEVNLQDDWKSAYFTAGKYLTDDFYISYTKGFGEDDYNETNTEIVTLEYEVLRWLYLQLITGTSKTSGVDVIFKFN